MSRPVVLTLRKPTGEFIRKQAAYPTACPGVYRFPLPDECESCWQYDEYGYCDGSCGLPVTFSWHLVCQAGVSLSIFGFGKATVEAITQRLAEVNLVDFTLPLAEVVEAARRPEAAELRRIIAWDYMGAAS